MSITDLIQQEQDLSAVVSDSGEAPEDDFQAQGRASYSSTSEASSQEISVIVDRYHVDVICLQETHITVDSRG